MTALRARARTCLRLALASVALLALAAHAGGAERAPLTPLKVPAESYPFRLDSGRTSNPGIAPVAAVDTVIDAGDDVVWMRLRFDEATLSPGSELRLTSLEDGAVQRLGADDLVRWGNASAYFNGPAVRLELVLGAGTSGDRLRMSEVVIGRASDDPSPEDLCDGDDDRAPALDAAVGRLVITYQEPTDIAHCTGWISERGSATDKCHLSAGHCFLTATAAVLQFNVPASLSDCSSQNPAPQDQYPVDIDDVRFDGGFGEDWAVFPAEVNGISGLTDFQAQGAAAALATMTPPTERDVTVIGFGKDGDAGAGTGNACSCPIGGDGSRNLTQQSSFGLLTRNAGAIIEYRADTCGGSSGSPVYHDFGAPAEFWDRPSTSFAPEEASGRVNAASTPAARTLRLAPRRGLAETPAAMRTAKEERKLRRQEIRAAKAAGDWHLGPPRATGTPRVVSGPVTELDFAGAGGDAAAPGDPQENHSTCDRIGTCTYDAFEPDGWTNVRPDCATIQAADPSHCRKAALELTLNTSYDKNHCEYDSGQSITTACTSYWPNKCDCLSSDFQWWPGLRDKTYQISACPVGGKSKPKGFFYYWDDVDEEFVLITPINTDPASGCAELIYTAERDADHYVQIINTGNRGGVDTSYTFVVETCTEDAFEEDDDAADAKSAGAKPLPYSSPTDATSYRHCDDASDWLRFDPTSGSRYRIRTCNLGTESDTLIALYEEEGNFSPPLINLLAEDDDGLRDDDDWCRDLRVARGYDPEDAPDLLGSELIFTAADSGRHYVEVGNFFDQGGREREWAIQIAAYTPTPPACSDSFEEDDNPLTLGPVQVIVADDPAQSRDHCDDAHDYVKFTAPATDAYLVSACNLGSRSDASLKLYDDPGASPIAENDDAFPNSCPGLDFLAAEILFQASAGEVRYLDVGSFRETIGVNTEYTLQVTRARCDPDAGEENDTLDVATDLEPNTPVPLTPNHCDDPSDWYLVETTRQLRPEIFALRGSAAPSTYQIDFTVFAPDRTPVATGSNSIFWVPSTWAVGSHLFHAGATDTGPGRSYTLWTDTDCQKDPNEDADDVHTGAVALAVGSCDTRNFCHEPFTPTPVADPDWIRFDAVAGEAYHVEVCNLSVGADAELALWGPGADPGVDAPDATASAGGTCDPGAPAIDFVAAATGAHKVRIRTEVAPLFANDNASDYRVCLWQPAVSAIGLHTNGGCNLGPEATNAGVKVLHPTLQSAIDSCERDLTSIAPPDETSDDDPTPTEAATGSGRRQRGDAVR